MLNCANALASGCDISLVTPETVYFPPSCIILAKLVTSTHSKFFVCPLCGAAYVQTDCDVTWLFS